MVNVRVTRISDGQLLRLFVTDYHSALAYMLEREDNELIMIVISEVV